MQWQQNVGCLKNLGRNLWFFTSKMFFFLRAPFLTLALAIGPAPDPLDSASFGSWFSLVMLILRRPPSEWSTELLHLYGCRRRFQPSKASSLREAPDLAEAERRHSGLVTDDSYALIMNCQNYEDGKGTPFKKIPRRHCDRSGLNQLLGLPVGAGAQGRAAARAGEETVLGLKRKNQ